MKKSIYKKELGFLRNAVEIKEKSKKNIITSPTTIKIINILEEFISKNKFICYGGMAINNILPENKQFYDLENEIPDYDFFSKNAIEDAKKLADIYYKNGFENAEAKSALHEGTYKVYVNFLQVADITQIENNLFNNLKKQSINIKNILYAPPNFLRMSIYLELSRPNGDVSRWEKIYNRLQLLNKYHPIQNVDCRNKENKIKNKLDDNIYKNIKNIFINNGCVFFGGYSIEKYKKNINKKSINNNTFYIFSTNLDSIKYEITNKIKNSTFKLIKSKNKKMPSYLIIYVNNIIYAKIFVTNACFSYNNITINNKKVKIATLYTMLSMYLLFLYVSNGGNKNYYNDLFEYDLLCTSEFLLDVYKKNRLKNKGIFKNYSLKCYGKQETFEKIILKRNEIYEKLKSNKNSEEYQKWFLRYNPDDKKSNKKTVKNKKKSGGS